MGGGGVRKVLVKFSSDIRQKSRTHWKMSGCYFLHVLKTTGLLKIEHVSQ